MRIDVALTAVNASERYLRFVPHYVKAWLNVGRGSVQPLVVFVGDELPPSLRKFHRFMRLLAPVEGVPTSVQAQCVRLYYPAIERMKNPDQATLISDVDMIPLSRWLVEAVRDAQPHEFVVYRNMLSGVGEIPICYNAATPEVWAETFGVASEEELRRAIAMLKDRLYDTGTRGTEGFHLDQRLLFEAVRDRVRAHGSVRFLQDRHPYPRFDRGTRAWSMTPLFWPAVVLGRYRDAHLPELDETTERQSRLLVRMLRYVR